MDKCLIIDGHNLLFQMFYGIPKNKTTKDNIYINAVIGFIQTLNKSINYLDANKVLVLFDSEKGSFRNQLSTDYKANRIDYKTVPDVDNPFVQLPIVKICLDYLEIVNIEAYDNFETDDIIASYCIQNAQQINYIMSFDSDFFQLINETTFVYRYNSKNPIIWDANKVISSFGVKPNQISDYKVLVGDSADNIKGVSRIGKVTASKLLNTYNNLDNIYINIDVIKPASISKSLKENINVALSNRDLIKLNGLIPLPSSFNNLEIKNKNFNVFDILKTLDLI